MISEKCGVRPVLRPRAMKIKYWQVALTSSVSKHRLWRIFCESDGQISVKIGRSTGWSSAAIRSSTAFVLEHIKLTALRIYSLSLCSVVAYIVYRGKIVI